MCLGQCFLSHKRLARLCFCGAHRAPCAVCVRMLDIISSDDKEGEQNVLNLFLDIEVHSSLGKLVESLFEDEELARRALSCHLAMDLLCQEMQAAC